MVSDCVRNAAENALRAVHALVADDNEIGAYLADDAQYRRRGATVGV
jgi:hypothetical protein